MKDNLILRPYYTKGVVYQLSLNLVFVIAASKAINDPDGTAAKQLLSEILDKVLEEDEKSKHSVE